MLSEQTTKLIMKKIEMRIKILAIYQLIAGLIGILGIFYLIPIINLLDKVVIIFIGLYGFSIYSGYLLLKKNYIKGLNLSIINQLFQVLSFALLGFAYTFYSGIYLTLGLNLTNDTLITYNFGITTWGFKLNSNSQIAEFSINFVALILINVISNLKEKIEKK